MQVTSHKTGWGNLILPRLFVLKYLIVVQICSWFLNCAGLGALTLHAVENLSVNLYLQFYSFRFNQLQISQYACTKSLQLCPTLYNPMGYSSPGSSVHADSPGKNTGVCCHALLQGIFPTKRLNLPFLCLLHWQAGSLPLAPPGKPNFCSTEHIYWKKRTMQFKPITYKIEANRQIILLSAQFSSVTQSSRTLCDPMNWSTSGLPVHLTLVGINTQSYSRTFLSTPSQTG